MDDSGGAFPDLTLKPMCLMFPTLQFLRACTGLSTGQMALSVTDAEAVQLIESHLLQPIEASALIDAFLHRKNSLE